MVGRQILYAILIAIKTIDTRLKCSKSAAISKFDIKKAYDHIN